MSWLLVQPNRYPGACLDSLAPLFCFGPPAVNVAPMEKDEGCSAQFWVFFLGAARGSDRRVYRKCLGHSSLLDIFFLCGFSPLTQATNPSTSRCLYSASYPGHIFFFRMKSPPSRNLLNFLNPMKEASFLSILFSDCETQHT